jgi:RNA polymerase primary sigma factor
VNPIGYYTKVKHLFIYGFTIYDLMLESLQIEIERALQTLTPREADLVRLYFGLNGKHPMTLEEIGETFDLTRERVRQIKEKAIKRLKHNSRSKILKSYLGK